MVTRSDLPDTNGRCFLGPTGSKGSKDNPWNYITPVAIGDLVITGAIAFAVPIVLVEIHKFFGRKSLKMSEA